MAAKGSKAKQEIFDKLIEMFPGSFMYNDGKECRINLTEDGAAVQIKVALTAAKTPVEPDGSAVSEAAADFNWDDTTKEKVDNGGNVDFPVEDISEFEKQNLQRLISKLGF